MDFVKLSFASAVELASERAVVMIGINIFLMNLLYGYKIM